MRKAKDNFISEWKDVFQLDSRSPSGLSWKIDGNNKSIGKPVGYLTELNYWKCEYKSKSIFVHRIIYYLSNGKLDETKVIDHIDGNPLNNNSENLREITYAENCRNKTKPINNKSGVMGLHECHDFVVTWSENGKSRSKKFSVLKLGQKAKELAIQFRIEKLEYLNSIDLNYSERHKLQSKEQNEITSSI